MEHFRKRYAKAFSLLDRPSAIILRDGEPREDGWSVHKTGRLNGYFYMNLPGTLIDKSYTL